MVMLDQLVLSTLSHLPEIPVAQQRQALAAGERRHRGWQQGSRHSAAADVRNLPSERQRPTRATERTHELTEGNPRNGGETNS